jgi:sugar fermentation stimulation protein A
MRFEQPLIPGRLVRRYKRFLADVRLQDGETVLAHCPNPGAMLGLSDPGLRVWLRPSGEAKRKLAYSWALVEAEIPGDDDRSVLVGVDTLLPNRLMHEALLEGRLSAFAGYASIRREVRFGARSRADFLLEGEGLPRLWLEVKNCHLSRTKGLAEFPDCAAARSARHAGVLQDQAAQGDRAVLAFVVQREDCEVFSPAADIDPRFAEALRGAEAGGVEVLVYGCAMGLEGVAISRRLAYAPVRPSRPSVGDGAAIALK